MFHSSQSEDIWTGLKPLLRRQDYYSIERVIGSTINILREHDDDLRMLFYLSLRVPDEVLEVITEKYFSGPFSQKERSNRVAFMQAVETARRYDRHMTPHKAELLHRQMAC